MVWLSHLRKWRRGGNVEACSAGPRDNPTENICRFCYDDAVERKVKYLSKRFDKN